MHCQTFNHGLNDGFMWRLDMCTKVHIETQTVQEIQNCWPFFQASDVKIVVFIGEVIHSARFEFNKIGSRNRWGFPNLYLKHDFTLRLDCVCIWKAYHCWRVMSMLKGLHVHSKSEKHMGNFKDYLGNRQREKSGKFKQVFEWRKYLQQWSLLIHTLDVGA